jgi:hypothetical protein
VRNIPPDYDPTSIISGKNIMINATIVARSRPFMASADVDLNPDRRTFLAQAAGVSALALVVGPAFAEAVDPIFVAIGLHRAAAVAVRAQVDVHCELERELPRNVRESSVTSWEEKIVETDDPRWIESEHGVAAAFNAETEAACTLVNVLPTTIAGVVALLQYAVSADTDGQTWPDDLLADEAGNRSRSWHHFLVANLAEILPGMVSA